MLKFMLLVSCVAYASALFQCPPNYCDSVDCAELTDCKGEVKANAGWCGCCDACITQLAKGDSCASMMLLGVPSTKECAKPLTCDPSTWTCQFQDAPSVHKRAVGVCAARLAEVRRSIENGLPLIGVMEPKCDDNGEYLATQCMGSVCYCVDDGGNMIDGYQVNIGELASMNCQCARDKVAYMKTGLIGKLFYCDKYGNYQNAQNTQAPAAAQTTVKAGNIVLGTGSGTTAYPGSPYAVNGDCYKALQTAGSSTLLGASKPECDADGRYAPRQCQGSECYCVRKDGTKIEGYSAPIASIYQVTCQCARDKDTALTQGLLGNIHTCRANGNYQQYQCLGSVCYCTDDAGVRMEEHSVPIGNINDLKC